MRLYSCKVQLFGSRDNEVRKIHVSAAEIVLLRHIHSLNPTGEDEGEGGIDPSVVSDIVYTGEVARSDAEERSRLAALYGPGLRRFDTIKNINGVFGVGTPLPQSLPEDNIQDAPKRGRKRKPAPKAPEEVPVEIEIQLEDDELSDLAG